MVGGTVGKPFTLEINGERGWIRITGDFVGGFQGGVLTLETSRGDPSPAATAGAGLVGPPANIAASYARLADDIRNGTHTVPDFATAVHLSQLLEQVDQASLSGHRTQGAG